MKKMKKVLFLGDSITDALRDYSENAHGYIGQGYALMAAGKLALDHPGEYEFTNKGVSGNRIVDMYARIKKDCWNLQPDVASILLGVNDVWHEFDGKNGVETERFENIYRILVKETLEKLPNLKLMLMEPFCIHGGVTDTKYDAFRSEVEKRAEATRTIAEEFNLPFVALQNKMDETVEIYGEKNCCYDGVHPNLVGSKIICEEWLKIFKKYILREG